METVLNSFAQTMPQAAAGAPEFVHLLPAGTFSGDDGRGPYVIENTAELIAASLPAGRKLPIDVNHSIDHRGVKGEDSPAVGWIIALETRSDGIWGKVDWTDEGTRLVEMRSYGFISPVFNARKAKPHRLTRLLRAALCNDPNLVNLTALNTRQNGETIMEEELRKALGLAEGADDKAILDAVKKSLNTSTAATETLGKIAEAAGCKKDAKADDILKALHTSAETLNKIAEAAGCKKDAKADEVIKAVNARAGKTGNADDDPEKEELRDQVKELSTRLTEEVTRNAKERAETFVDKAIEDGKLVPALRERFITRHMKDPGDVEAEVKLMPSLHTGGLGKRRQLPGEGESQLSDTDVDVCALMGLDPKAFAKTSTSISKEIH